MSEVREGYKMTELGEIPSEWKVAPLNDLVIKITDGAHKTPKYTDIGVPFLRVTDIQSKEIDWNNTKYISKDEHVELIKRCNPEKGDLLLSKNGTIGILKLIDWEEEFSIFVSLCLIKLKKQDSSLNAKFLLHYLSSDVAQKQFKDSSKQGTVTNLHLTEIKKCKVPLLDINEQQKIASILSTVDEQIDETEQLIVKTKELKKGLMQQLLTKGIGHTEFKQTELGEIPVDWKVRTLEKVCYFSNGKAHEEFVDENGEYILINSKFISTEGKVAKNASEMLMPLEENDITIVMSDVPNGKAFSKCFLVPESDKYTLNQRIGLIRTDSMYSKFLFYQVNRNSYFLSFDNGVGQTNLRKADLLACPILVPSFEEQQKIAQILSTVDEQIEVYEQEKAKYEELKKGLMQQLLTGQIRVKI